MKKFSNSRLYWTLLIVYFIAPANALDRITMYHGDIFLGEIESTEDYRHTVERFGFKNIVPSWWVKKIEPDEEVLLTQEEQNKFPPLGMNTISGIPVSVTSHSPAQASHLELYPKRSHFWMASKRYLRGYLVNQTEDGYQHLRVKVSYYADGATPVYWHEVELFDVYPKTMKPFIVDAQHVPWKRVKGVSFVVIGGVRWATENKSVRAQNGG